MSLIHFFASTDDIETQSGVPGDEAFGPVEKKLTSQFRVTSLHKGVLNGSVRTNPVAYSICSGRVRVQQDNTNPDLVNLVLAPNSDLINGLPIKYFIYRGIRRDSLIDSNDNLIPGEFTNILLNDGNPENNTPDALGLAFRSAIDSPPNPIFTREDDDSIDTLFFETTTLKALLINQSGLKLGLFHGEHFGFEIVIDSCWEDTTIDILRNIDISSTGAKGNFIDVPNSSSTVKARAIRERVYKYMDIAAFLGLCKPKDISYAVSNSQNPPPISDYQDLYEIILKKFHNRHKIYIDIRNENGLSYNYYDKYTSNEIILIPDNTDLKWRNKINPEIDTNQPVSYLTHEWPIKIIDEEDPTFIIKNGSNKAGIRIALNLGDDSVERRAIIRVGFLYYNKNGKSFFGKLYKPKNDGSIQNIVNSGNWTNEITLATPIVTISSVQKPIASYIRILYDRQHESIPSTPGRFVATPSSWDNLFVIKPKLNKWQNNRLTSWWLTGQLKFVSPQLGKQQVYEGLVESGVAIDRDSINMEDARLTFYYIPIISLQKPSNYRVISGTSVSGTGGIPGQPASFFQLKESGSFINDGALTLHLQKVSEYIGETEPTNPDSYLNFLTYTETVPVYLTDTNSIEPDEPQASPNNSRESLYSISMTTNEYQSIVSEIANQNFDTSLHPVFLQASIVNGRTSATKTERAYQKMELSLVGYDSNGLFKRFVVPTNTVQPLSLMSDGHLFCTDAAAKFEPTPIGWNFTEICEIIKNSNNSNEEHEADTRYYRSALSLIKRYNPVLYGRMESLRLMGAEIILHDNPFKKVRRKYRITVDFDPDFHDASGSTIANAFYKGVFPGMSSPTYSNAGVKIFNLSTSQAINNLNQPSPINNLYNNDAIGHLNATRYALLNRDLNLHSSQVNELFMNDYTDQEIDNDVFNGNKLYIESLYNANGNGRESSYHRITLANVKSLGLGTLNPEEPIEIRINRSNNRLGMYEDKKSSQIIEFYDEYDSLLKVEKANEIDPRINFVMNILIHELGHTEYMIKNPMNNFIWSELESYFRKTTTDYRLVIETNKINPEFKDYYLAPYVNYPTPSSIIPYELVPDPTNSLTDNQKKDLAHQFYQNLVAMEFYVKTGQGHLRGNPTAQNACLEERTLANEISKINSKIIEEIKTKRRPENASYTKTIPAVSVDYAYCFLNFEDSNI